MPIKPLRVPAQVPLPRPGIRLAFVGEAPSWEELTYGEPFVGPSGRIFNTALRLAGIDRASHLVTNVFDEKLPDNSIREWLMPAAEAHATPDGTDVPPLPGGFLRMEHRHHLDRLKKELEAWDATVIVPLGGTALWALTGMEGISAVRGTVVKATRLVPGRKLLPTFHPEFVRRLWKFLPVVVGDFLRAQAEAKRGPQITLPHREITVEPTLEDIRAYLPRLLSSQLLSVDIETGWGQIKSIGFAPDVEHALVIPFIDTRQPDRNYWRTAADEVAAWKLVREALASPVPKLGQNFAGYDLYWLLKKMHLTVRNLREDTRLLSHALYPELPKDLEFMGASYASQGAWKFWARHDDKRDN